MSPQSTVYRYWIIQRTKEGQHTISENCLWLGCVRGNEDSVSGVWLNLSDNDYWLRLQCWGENWLGQRPLCDSMVTLKPSLTISSLKKEAITWYVSVIFFCWSNPLIYYLFSDDWLRVILLRFTFTRSLRAERTFRAAVSCSRKNIEMLLLVRTVLSPLCLSVAVHRLVLEPALW